MSWVAVAVGGGAIVGGLLASDAQSDAAGQAAGAQRDSSAAGIAEQRRQFDAIQALLKPYNDAGAGALLGQQNLIGLKGPDAQRQAISALESSPMFTSLQQQGENALLQNASATGGLRGGNLQTSLAKFRPQLLSALIEQQFSKLGGLTSVGQNAAAMTGNAGMGSANSISNLLMQGGDAQAMAALAQGRANAGAFNSIGSGVGAFAGLGGFGRLSNGPYAVNPNAPDGSAAFMNGGF